MISVEKIGFLCFVFVIILSNFFSVRVNGMNVKKLRHMQ